MPELRLQIPDELVQELQEKLGDKIKVTDIAREALTLYNWAVQERAKERVILSSDQTGGDVARLVMPSLQNVRSNKPK